MIPFAQRLSFRHGNRFKRSISRCLLAGGALALSFGIPILDNPLALPTAHAHHGGGGSGGGSGGGGSGGGGKGDGINSIKPAVAVQPSPSDGQGKGGRGFEGLKP